MDIQAWAKQLQANLSSKNITPAELLNSLPSQSGPPQHEPPQREPPQREPPQRDEEGPPAKVAKMSKAEAAAQVAQDLKKAVEAREKAASLPDAASSNAAGAFSAEELKSRVSVGSDPNKCCQCQADRSSAVDTTSVDELVPPDPEAATRKAHWSQVFATFQKSGQANKALEYAKGLSTVRAATTSAFTRYKEVVAAELALQQSALPPLPGTREADMGPGGEEKNGGSFDEQGRWSCKLCSLKASSPAVQFVADQYAEALQGEADLLQKAYLEALERYNAIHGVQTPQVAEAPAVVEEQPSEEVAQAYQQAYLLQVQAQQDVAAKEWELRRIVDGAAQFASRTAGDFEESQVAQGIARPRRQLPQRHGMQPCAFYLKTGDCAYGSGCKWDHPPRDGFSGQGCFNCGGPHLARECTTAPKWYTPGSK